MLNPFFQQGSKGEQSLVQSLINEQLKIYGVEVYYLPRIYATKNSAIKEVIESKFTNAYPIEAYVDSYEGYGGLGTLMSKFGIQEQDDLTIIVSKERYENYISPLIKNIPNIELSSRPKEGDLIYFPLGDRLFEIKYVEHEKPFYQLQKNYVYELRCELFRVEDEVVDTDVSSIDDNLIDQGYIQTLTLVGSAVTATAITGIAQTGGLRKIVLTNRGDGFTSPPRVAISSAPSTGQTAVGIATMISGLIDCYGSTADDKVQGVEIINPGFGYTVAPGISFVGGGGAGVAATTEIADGTIGIITVSDGGNGYSTAPLVTIAGPGIGTTASATALISSAGIVTSIRITDAGVGYTVAPTITIGSPSVGSSGNFIFNETVTGSASSTTAIVNNWDASTNVLEIKVVSGTFVVGENIVGSESGASRELRVLNTDDAVTPYAQNDVFESEADSFLDFSETNPFGTP